MVFLFLIFFFIVENTLNGLYCHLEKSLLGFKKQTCLFLELSACVIHLPYSFATRNSARVNQSESASRVLECQPPMGA